MIKQSQADTEIHEDQPPNFLVDEFAGTVGVILGESVNIDSKGLDFYTVKLDLIGYD